MADGAPDQTCIDRRLPCAARTPGLDRTIGHGVAIPTDAANRIRQRTRCFLRSCSFLSTLRRDDGKAVDWLFAMVSAEQFTRQPLQLLSELAESFAKPSSANALRSARSADEALRTEVLDGSRDRKTTA
jgi:mannitol/fructose-specific phosphotransferase system IIA component (Ntr-type)